jgi:hypothetical protein
MYPMHIMDMYPLVEDDNSIFGYKNEDDNVWYSGLIHSFIYQLLLKPLDHWKIL